MSWIFEPKIDTHEALTYNELCNLINAYRYDAASTVEPVIAFLGNMYKHLIKDETYTYYNKDGNLNTIIHDNFKEFILTYFGEYMYSYAVTFPVENKIRNNKVIFYEELEDLIRFGINDKEFGLNSVINVLHHMIVKLRRGEECYCYDKAGTFFTITMGGFRDFVTHFFCAAMYDEVYSDYKSGRYRKFRN